MLLITPSEVVEYAFTPREEISPQSIRTVKIDIASDHFVRPRFGDALYDKFTEGEYQPYVEEYLKPAIAHFVRYAIIDELSIQMSQSGAMCFENEHLQAEQTKTTTLKAVDESTATGSGKNFSQMTVETKKTDKNSTTAASERDTESEATTIEDSQSIGEKLVTDTNKRTSEKRSDVDRTLEVTTSQTVTDTGTEEHNNQTDYNYMEAPVTIGIGREGYSHEVLDGETTAKSVKSGSDSTTEKNFTKVDDTVNDLKTISDKSDVGYNKNGHNLTTQSTTESSNSSLNGESISEQSNTGNTTVESLKEVTATSDRTGADDGQSISERSRSHPATDYQRRIIRARALADANILLAKAVRYIERHAELFPEYKPLPCSFGRIVL